MISGSLRPRFPEGISRRPRSLGGARETQSAENIAETIEKHFETGDKLKEGWAYPGDIGTIDEGGFLRLLGRTSDLIIRGGVNVHPSEVEAAIAEHEGVREVAVVGFANLPEGEEIAAFVVPSGNLTEASLVAHCRARLSSDKRPRKFAFVTKLPRNAKWQDFSGDASPGTRQRRLTPLLVAGSGELSRYSSIASRFQSSHTDWGSFWGRPSSAPHEKDGSPTHRAG